MHKEWSVGDFLDSNSGKNLGEHRNKNEEKKNYSSSLFYAS